MSGSSPSDLAVTFRSIPRRRREARGDAEGSLLDEIDGELDAQLRAAATTLHSGSDPEAIASAIDAIRADEWDQTQLEQLRQGALDIGRLLRAMATAAHDAQD